MILFFLNWDGFLRSLWLVICLFLVLLTFIKKADDDKINFSQIPSLKKSEKFFDNIIWFFILLYLILGLILSTNFFS
jgi:preprotein translocase subunit SecG